MTIPGKSDPRRFSRNQIESKCVIAKGNGKKETLFISRGLAERAALLVMSRRRRSRLSAQQEQQQQRLLDNDVDIEINRTQ